MENLQFRVKASLKDIIGRDLITNDLVAIFELVKPSSGIIYGLPLEMLRIF